jgi:hypothetical protein
MKSLALGIFLGVMVLTSLHAGAAPPEFPIPRLHGVFSYHQHFSVPQIRRAETVNVQNPEGEKRVNDLRQEGYTCLRKNLNVRLCSKVWTPEKNPEGLDKSVSQFMTPIVIEFSGGSTPPELIHDGSTTQEWQVSEKVKVIQSELSVYRVVKTNKNQIFVVFPVSESQPLSPLLYHSENTLSISVIANSKDTATSTLAYSIEALLEKAP